MKYLLLALALTACGTTTPRPPIATPPVTGSTKGQEIGAIYEAYLSPFQEPGEEADAPSVTPKQFLSTAPSTNREARPARGHGTLRFTRDLSRAYIDLTFEGLNAQEVVMFHIHCGKPDQLGPILVDFGLVTNLPQRLATGTFTFEVSNADIVNEIHTAHDVVGAITAGCPIVPGTLDKVKTVAGMEHIARRSELYFNLHTRGQTFYGYMRGQIHPAVSR